jgi:hypothetical protein
MATDIIRKAFESSSYEKELRMNSEQVEGI